jgi:flagellar biosynthesis protein FlhF
MKINRFKGTEMRETMRLVRAALGPDAVILETNRDEDGVEIAAAVDFNPVEYRRLQESGQGISKIANRAKPDVPTPAVANDDPKLVATPEVRRLEAEVENIRHLLEAQLARLVWDDSVRRSPQEAGIMHNLARLGIEPDVVAGLLGQMDDDDLMKNGWTASLKYLAESLVTSEEDLVCRGGIFALVGPTGVGKTTTIAKLAARYVMRHGRDKIAFVTTDGYKIAAREQLETFGQILGAPVYEATDSDSLGKVLHSLADKGLVLIDTAGMGQKDMRLAQQLGCLSHADADIEVLLTLPANVQSESMQEIFKAFRLANPTACILTKVDEAASLGGALSAMIRSELPLAYVTNGQRVPEDLHFAHPRRAWLIKSAVESMNRCERPITDEFMAQHFGEVLANECA